MTRPSKQVIIAAIVLLVSLISAVAIYFYYSQIVSTLVKVSSLKDRVDEETAFIAEDEKKYNDLVAENRSLKIKLDRALEENEEIKEELSVYHVTEWENMLLELEVGGCLDRKRASNNSRFKYVTNELSNYLGSKVGIYQICKIDNGSFLLAGAGNDYGQFVAKMKDDEFVDHINLNVKTVGELGPAFIENIDNDNVMFSIGGGDAGLIHNNYYVLSYIDFSYDELFLFELGVNAEGVDFVVGKESKWYAGALVSNSTDEDEISSYTYTYGVRGAEDAILKRTITLLFEDNYVDVYPEYDEIMGWQIIIRGYTTEEVYLAQPFSI